MVLVGGPSRSCFVNLYRSYLRLPVKSGGVSSKFHPKNTAKPRSNSSPNNDIVIKNGDFTNFGILPFFQDRLNHLLSDSPNKYVESNVEPTSDQRKLLSVLQANYSIIHRGETQAGNTLAMIAYALNLSLSRVPNYKYLLPQGQGQDSIIVVPTDDLMDKYKSIVESLLVGIPEDCCPGELKLENRDLSDRNYTLTRVPLTVSFHYSHKPHTQVTTATSPNSNSIPQIIVTTLPNLVKLQGQYTRQSLANLKLVAVDDFDLFLRATHINSDTLIEKRGPKGKYYNILEDQIKKLQQYHMDSFIKLTEKRLKRIEQLSIGDARLKERLEKERRRVLYKPIQYCFLTKPEHHYKQMLNVKTNANVMKELNMSIARSTTVKNDSTFHQNLNQTYAQYLIDKGSRINEKYEDSQTAFIEKVVKFNDDQRVYKKNERQIIKVGSFGPNFTNPINAFFTIGMANNNNLNDIIIKDLSWKVAPSKINTIMDRHIALSRRNVKNLEKSFLKFKMLPNHITNNNAISAKLIDGAITNFRKSAPENGPIVIVVSSYCDTHDIARKLNKINKKRQVEEGKLDADVYKAFKTYESLSELQNGTNIILTSEQLIGQTINGVSNMLVLGLDSLLYQTSFSTASELKQHALNSNDVSGIIDPVGNLIYYYLSKLNASMPNKEKNFIFVADGIVEKKDTKRATYVEQDLKKLGELIFYNGLPEVLNVKKFSDIPNLRKKIPVGIDQTFVDSLKELHRANSS